MVGLVKHLTLSTPPPSVNDMYIPASRGNMIISKAGHAWINGALAELITQYGIGHKPCYWRGDYLIPGAGSRTDIGNYEKALTDTLVKAKLVPDDRYLVDIRLRFYNGNNVKIAIQKEDLHKWATIKNVSKSTIRKLAKSSGL